MGLEERALRALDERNARDAATAREAAAREEARQEESEARLISKLDSWFEVLSLRKPPRPSFSFDHWTSPNKDGLRYITAAAFSVEGIRFWCRMTDNERPVVFLEADKNDQRVEIKDLADLGVALNRHSSS